LTLLFNWRIWLAVAIAIALAASHWRAYKQGEKSAALECSIERQAAAEQARERREANQARAREVEIKFVDREKIRVETVTKIVTEVRDETSNLASCKLDAGDIRMLNAAANSGSKDRPAANHPDASLPNTRPADK